MNNKKRISSAFDCAFSSISRHRLRATFGILHKKCHSIRKKNENFGRSSTQIRSLLQRHEFYKEKGYKLFEQLKLDNGFYVLDQYPECGVRQQEEQHETFTVAIEASKCV